MGKVKEKWSKKVQKNLLTKVESMFLSKNEKKTETDKAFDLLDALSRSGSLLVQSAELHVVVAVTHCFEKSLIDTVIKDNINPIENIERSLLLVSTTIHDESPKVMVTSQAHLNTAKHSPELFES